MMAALLEGAEYVGAPKPARGTSNTNDRGSAAARRARKEWLIQTYRADSDLSAYEVQPHPWYPPVREMVPLGSGIPAARCYRCALLLWMETITVDRIIPGCEGGTYRRNNIRPACGKCNSSTGQALSVERRKAKR